MVFGAPGSGPRDPRPTRSAPESHAGPTSAHAGTPRAASQVAMVGSTTQALATHAWPPGQAPQSWVQPQPSSIVPQAAPAAAQVRRVQQAPAVHTWPAPQVPQESVPPHPSESVPQTRPAAAQVVGVQHALEAQTCPPPHVPQESVPPHPSGIEPHAPAGQAAGVHAVW